MKTRNISLRWLLSASLSLFGLLVTTQTAQAATGATSSVSNVSVAHSSATSVLVSWNAPASGTPSFYSVEYRELPAGSWTQFSTQEPIVGSQVEVTGLQSGVEYQFRVTANADSTAQLSRTFGVRQLAAGANHTCELFDDGTVSCWGSNTFNQIGPNFADGTTYSSVPVAVNLTNVTKISAGREHTCALTSAGDVYCWGSNSNGQTGNGDSNLTQVDTPQKVVNVANAIDLAAGSMHTCVVLADGTAKCWGAGAYARLGYEANPTQNADRYVANPVLLSDGTTLSGLASITAGTAQTCALKTDGTVYCWGNNNVGQLGRGGAIAGGNTSNTPAQVVSLTNVRQISSGHQHVCAVTTANAIYCWGAGAKSQLGLASTSNVSTPTAVKRGAGTLTGVAEVAAGWESTCAITLDGVGYCWGNNANGQLGDGTTAVRNTATQISGISSLVSIAVDRSSNTSGSGHACAVTAASVVYCWGLNSIPAGSADGPRGALGNGTTTNSVTPVSVSGDHVLSFKVMGAPSTPAWQTVVPADQSVALAWTIPNDNGSALDAQFVEFASGDKTGTACEVLITSTSCEVTGLTNGVSYTFWLSASNSLGLSQKQESQSVVPGKKPDNSTWVSAEALDRSVALTWQNGGINGSSVTDVEVRFNQGDKSGIACDVEPGVTQCLVEDLTNGVSYDFTISQRNAFGWSDTVVSTASTPGRVPDAVSRLLVSGTGTTARLSWNSPDSNGAALSKIEVNFSSGNRSGAACSPSIDSTSCSVSGLTPGVAYSFSLVSTNSFGTSSATTSTKWTPYLAPSKVSGLSGRQLSKTSVAWKWNAPSSFGGSAVLRYEYQISKNGSTWPSIWTSVGTSRALTISKLSKKSTNYLRVRAISKAGLASIPVSSSFALK
mgnify:CR=1 FL=1